VSFGSVLLSPYFMENNLWRLYLMYTIILRLMYIMYCIVVMYCNISTTRVKNRQIDIVGENENCDVKFTKQ